MVGSYESFDLDRALYSVLVINLYRDLWESMEIVALCRWFKMVDHQFFKKILDLPEILINEFAEEAVLCLKCASNKLFVCENLEIPLIQCLLDKEISLTHLQMRRTGIVKSIVNYLQEDGTREFASITGQVVSERYTKPRKIISTNCAKTYKENSKLFVDNGEDVLALEDRTVFVMFRCPVSELEMREMFMRNFGECVESVHLQEVKKLHEQVSYARVVFKLANAVEMVLNGKEKVKVTINDKHVWVRKLVPMRPEYESVLNSLSDFPSCRI